jgi:hypothetical protein
MKRIHVLDITLGLGLVLMAVIASAGPGGEHWQTQAHGHPGFEHRHSGPRYTFGENKALTEAMQRSREAARDEAVEFYYFLVNSDSQVMHIRSDPYLAPEGSGIWVEVGWVNGTEDEEAHRLHIESINGERVARGLDTVIISDMRW